MAQYKLYLLIFCLTLSSVLAQLPSTAIPLQPIGNTGTGTSCNDFALLHQFGGSCRVVAITINTCITCGIIGLKQFYNCSTAPGTIIQGFYYGGTYGSIVSTYSLTPFPSPDSIIRINGTSSGGGQLGTLGFLSRFGIQGTYGNSVAGSIVVNNISPPYCLFSLDTYVKGTSCTGDASATINGVLPYSNNQFC